MSLLSAMDGERRLTTTRQWTTCFWNQHSDLFKQLAWTPGPLSKKREHCNDASLQYLVWSSQEGLELQTVQYRQFEISAACATLTRPRFQQRSIGHDLTHPAFHFELLKDVLKHRRAPFLFGHRVLVYVSKQHMLFNAHQRRPLPTTLVR